MTEATKTRMGYNVTITPLTVVAGKNVKGTEKITGRATVKKADGSTLERTFVAQGAAAAAVGAVLKVGETVTVRAFYDRAPANDQGKRGGEYLTLLALPKAKAA